MNRFKIKRLMIFLILAAIFYCGAGAVRAADLYVNTNADNTNCDNDLTLREAILLARSGFNRPLTAGEAARVNAASIAGPPAPGCPGPFGYSYDSGVLGASVGDSIRFENSVTTISPNGGLPFIYSGDFVFGLKPNGTKVILSGAGSGAGTNGLSFTRNTAGIDGGGATNMIIRDFTASGIFVEGIFCQFENLVINNNGGAGIFLTGKETSLGNFIDPRPRIESNFIYSNGNFGIEYLGTIDAIGSDAPSCSGHIINNYIGYRDATLATDDGNGSDGIRITNCSDIRIGISITDVDGGNYIGGNGGDGIQIKGAKTYNHRIVNNRIGKTATTGGGFGNDLSGISVLNGAGQQPTGVFAPIQIGEINKNNVISGNANSGVYLSDANSQAIISNNYIGTNTGANTDLGNGAAGVTIVNSATAYVGGDASGAGNVLAYNTQGVYMTGNATSANIRRNRMFGNDFLGIDLNADGVTPNDPNDADTGPNGLQNYPVLTGVSGGSSTTTVAGNFNSTPNRNYIVQFFGNTSCSAAGYGEGRTFLGEASVATNASGNATINAALAIGISNAGNFVTATAIDTTTAQTSEFSQCQPVVCNYSLSATSTSVGNGASNGSFQILTTGGCDWTAVSNASWITITGGGSGNGNGTISFSVVANTTGAARSGTITAGGQTFTVTQAAGTCSYSLSPASISFGSNAASGSFQIVTTAGCNWTAVSNNSWITITGGSSGSGNDTVFYNVAANTGAARTGTITAGGQTYTINQASGCTYNLPQNSLNVSASGGTFATSISAGAGCAWTATSNAAWISTSSNGTGSGTFQYTVQANTGAARSGTITVGGQIFTINQAAATVTRKRFDFDGDGKSDVSVFRPSNGVWYLQQSQNGFAGFAFGQNGDRIAPADYDGDGKTDIAVVRNGTWYLQRSSLGFTGIVFGDGNDLPMPADYDGDGKDDLAVFRPSNGVWYIQRSSLGFTGIGFGQSGDVPAAADYDGDGKADIAVFRPSNGVWYIQQSTAGFVGFAFGANGDKPAAADYDGDGKADIAVFRPSNGTWYLQQSQAGFVGIAFGAAGDLPAAADFDGDGKTDVAVFRPSNGVWYLQRSTQGFTGIGFGATGDRPAPNAFVP